MIDQNKTYRTESGRAVRIYAIDGAEPYVVHGAMKCEDGTWENAGWTIDGKIWAHRRDVCLFDLVEVQPRFRHTYWVNVYPTGVFNVHPSKQQAAFAANDKRIACVEVVIEGQEGDGL